MSILWWPKFPHSRQCNVEFDSRLFFHFILNFRSKQAIACRKSKSLKMAEEFMLKEINILGETTRVVHRVEDKSSKSNFWQWSRFSVEWMLAYTNPAQKLLIEWQFFFYISTWWTFNAFPRITLQFANCLCSSSGRHRVTAVPPPFIICRYIWNRSLVLHYRKGMRKMTVANPSAIRSNELKTSCFGWILFSNLYFRIYFHIIYFNKIVCGGTRWDAIAVIATGKALQMTFTLS